MAKPKPKSVRLTFTTTPEKAKDAERVRSKMQVALPRATFVRAMFEAGLILQAGQQKECAK